jgi:hypothetical protein
VWSRLEYARLASVVRDGGHHLDDGVTEYLSEPKFESGLLRGYPKSAVVVNGSPQP